MKIRRPTLQPDGRLFCPDTCTFVLQRSFVADWQVTGERPPRSYGHLAFGASSDGSFSIPIMQGEIVWIGIEPVASNQPIAIEVYSPGERILHRICPPDFAIKGVTGSHGVRPIKAGDRFEITVRPQKTLADQTLFLAAIDADKLPQFRTLPPLDRKDGYSGDRLP